jgi:hypothetical protein
MLDDILFFRLRLQIDIIATSDRGGCIKINIPGTTKIFSIQMLSSLQIVFVLTSLNLED